MHQGQSNAIRQLGHALKTRVNGRRLNFMLHVIKGLLPFVLLSSLAGCTNIRFENSDIHERWYPGIVLIDVKPRKNLDSVIKSNGFGIIANRQSIVLGYVQESVFLASDATKCRMFIIVQTDKQMDELKQALLVSDEYKHICAIK